MDIDHHLRAALEQLHLEIRTHLEEMQNDLETELRLLDSVNADYSGTYAIGPNIQRWTRWAGTAIRTVSTLVGAGLMLVPGWQPVGVALAAGATLFKPVFDWVRRLWKSEDERRLEAVSKFREETLPHIKHIEGEIRKAYRKAFNEEIDRQGCRRCHLQALGDG